MFESPIAIAASSTLMGFAATSFDANDSWQFLARELPRFRRRSRRDDVGSVVAVAPLACVTRAFVLQDLLFDLVEHRGDRRVHVGRNFLAMIKIMPRFDIHFGDMTLVLFHSQDEVRFQNFIGNPAQPLEAVGGELSQRLGDFDVPTCDIDLMDPPLGGNRPS